MKKIKIYHENGTVKITKIAPTGIEQVLFSDLKEGEAAEIIIDFAPTLQAQKITS